MPLHQRLRSEGTRAPAVMEGTTVQRVESSPMSSVQTTHLTQLARDTKLLAGLVKNLPRLPTILLAGTTYTPPQFMAVVQSRVDAGTKVVNAKGAAHQAIADNHAETASTKVFMEQLVAAIVIAFSNAPDVLADCGLRPRKKAAPKTAAAKVIAAAKRAATRKARGTMGPNKKATVHGGVPATLTIDVPQPVPVATSEGPAASAGNGAPAAAPSNGPSPAPVAAPKGA